MAMCFVDAVAQCNCPCNNCLPNNVYYLLPVNGQECRFEGKNANVAATHLAHATENYFFTIDNKASAQNMRVYKLKKKGGYALKLGNSWYCLRNDVVTGPFVQQPMDVKREIYDAGTKEGFTTGYDPTRRLVLAIYRH